MNILQLRVPNIDQFEIKTNLRVKVVKKLTRNTGIIM